MSRFAAHIAQSFRHHFALQFATLVVLVAGFTVTASVLVLGDNLHRILTLWGESMQMSVYLSEGVSDQDVASVKKFIEDTGKFEPPKYVAKEETLKNFQEQIASYAPDILKDADILKFIPVSFQLAVKKTLSINDHLPVMQESAAALKALPGVDDVSFGQEWVKHCTSILQALNSGGAIFIAIILLSAVFVMANSIHSSVHQRRSEIEVLELVGATTRYIRGPFVVEGALLGGSSALIAVLLSFALFTFAREYLHAQAALLQVAQHLQFISLLESLGLVTSGAALGAAGAWLCVGRINTGWAAAGEH